MRIGIVGAGASGLTCGHLLQGAGHEQVTILERSERVGGKCSTVEVDGRNYEMGAVLGTAHYAAALGVMHPSGLRVGHLPGGHTYDPDGRRIDVVHAAQYPMLLHQFLFRYAWLTQLLYRRVNDPGHDGVNPDLYAPFADVARTHGFADLLVPMAGPFTGFGYGSFDDVPAAYVAKYLDVRTLEALSRPGHTYMWPDGIESVWRHIAEPLDVRTGWTVQQVARGDVVEVRTDRGELEFDTLILTGPLDEALAYLDASAEERRLFSVIEHEDYWVLLCDIEDLPEGNGTIQANLDPGRRGHVMVWCQRRPDDTLRTLYVRGDFASSQQDVEASCAADLQRLGATLQRVVQVRRWKYFPHVGTGQMSQGWYDCVEAMQGSRRTYYAGEVMSFSCIAACVQYARALVQRIA